MKVVVQLIPAGIFQTVLAQGGVWCRTWDRYCEELAAWVYYIGESFSKPPGCLFG
jgi:hypothetical protein